MRFVPSHTYGLHAGLPGEPAGTTAHVPGVALHVWHGALHAVWQHTLPTL